MLQSIKKIKFHESITAFGDTVSYYPLPRYIARFQVFYDQKTQLFQLTDKETTIFVPIVNVAWFELETKKTPKRTKTKPKLVQD